MPSSGASRPAPASGAAVDRSTLRVVRLMTVAAFASSASMRICDPLLPRLAEDFGAGLAATAAVITGFSLSYGLLQLAIGPLADRIGKFRVINLATLLAALASLACALAPGLDWMVLARIVAGGVGGAIIPVAFAWIGDEVPYTERQTVLARVMGGALLGVVSGQLVGGVFVDTIGWRWAFVALALMFAVVAVLMRVSLAARAGAPTPGPVRTEGGGPLALLRGYAEIARPPWARHVLLTVVVEGMLMYGALAFVPAALHERFGIALWLAAAVTALVGVSGYVYTLFARRLIGLFGERGLAMLGGSFVGAGLLAIGLAPVPAVAVLGAMMLGLGFYAFHNTLQVHGTQLSSKQRGMGMALFALGLFVGQSIGVAFASVLIAQAGFGTAFVVAGIAFVLLAAGFTRALGRHHAQAPG